MKNKHRGGRFIDHQCRSIEEDIIKGLNHHIRLIGVCEVSRRSGISRQGIYGVIKNKKDIRLSTLIRLSISVNMRPALIGEVYYD